MNRLDVREHEDAAAQLRRRMEREERRQAARHRSAATIAISLLVVVAVLAVGVAVAARVFEPQKVAATPAPSVSALAGRATPEIAVPAVRQTAATATAKAASPKQATAAPKAATPKPVATSKPVAAPKPVATLPKPVAVASPNQSFTIKLAGSGYDPSIIKASSKSPIKLTVGKGQGCAAGFVIPSLGINKNNSKGSVTFSVGRLKPGSYTYECSMGMVSGTLVVK
jgi:cytoskeletal protein RodZ